MLGLKTVDSEVVKGINVAAALREPSSGVCWLCTLERLLVELAVLPWRPPAVRVCCRGFVFEDEEEGSALPANVVVVVLRRVVLRREEEALLMLLLFLSDVVFAVGVGVDVGVKASDVFFCCVADMFLNLLFFVLVKEKRKLLMGKVVYKKL